MWTLIICTWGILGLCSDYSEQQYQSENSCYRALDSLYKHEGKEEFLYIKCKPSPPHNQDSN
jgi:hypothetical protein